ncbi:PREDICTED: synaptotagmin-2-like isoform X2 [Cyprinodon variegatus]|uniref:C2 domain-containing protein n=1 Tax=Cyprinodon variegatus TaxID=28743 RepID=A0A3Q2CZM0_CYPVA|nr:PREDICTED: synaptotagmin-2-like isoform X2 [Cyprinodon variegatus]
MFKCTEATWMQRDMLTFVELPVDMGLLSTSGQLRMPFSEAVKYCILGISILLLLAALGILIWQICRCFSQTYTSYPSQEDTVNRDLLYSDEKPSTAENYSAPPSTTVHGSLRFSIYYDQLQARLVVTVLQVEGLEDNSQAFGLQPFVKIRLMCAGLEGTELEGLKEQEGQATAPVLWTVLQEWRTRVVKGSCNPLYGDQFSCILPEKKDTLRHITLRMEVRDFDKFSRHTVLGEVRVPLGQLNISYPLELQEDLQIPQKDLVGEVLLSLKYLPTSQRLEIGLLKVRTAITETFSATALYARISIQYNQSKMRYQKTSAVPRSPVTVFNEVLMFTLPDFPLEQTKILVWVYETQATGKSSKCLLGQLSVKKDRHSEDEHWTLMVRSVRQPVAKWHGLLI